MATMAGRFPFSQLPIRLCRLAGQLLAIVSRHVITYLSLRASAASVAVSSQMLAGFFPLLAAGR